MREGEERVIWEEGYAQGRRDGDVVGRVTEQLSARHHFWIGFMVGGTAVAMGTFALLVLAAWPAGR